MAAVATGLGSAIAVSFASVVCVAARHWFAYNAPIMRFTMLLSLGLALLGRLQAAGPTTPGGSVGPAAWRRPSKASPRLRKMVKRMMGAL